MNRILVTGGTGFIGSYTCQELERCGYTPVVLDRLRNRPDSPYATVLGDVRDAVDVQTAVYAADGVIHLAGQLGTQETIPYPRPAIETNIVGTQNVLEAATKAGRPVVYISVGNYWMQNPYSITKHTAERLCLMARKELGTQVAIVRALNAYGPGQKAKPVKKIIPTFVNACLNGDPIRVYGDGEQVMDMVHVTDVARVLVAALAQLPERVVEAGTGRHTTVNEIARAVINEVGKGSLEHVPMRPGEDENSVVVADTATLLPLGVTADEFVRLEDGLRDTVAYYAPELIGRRIVGAAEVAT